MTFEHGRCCFVVSGWPAALRVLPIDNSQACSLRSGLGGDQGSDAAMASDPYPQETRRSLSAIACIPLFRERRSTCSQCGLVARSAQSCRATSDVPVIRVFSFNAYATYRHANASPPQWLAY